jgi:nitrite reductase/ring-hydroxylating ferredoxin subunit
VPHGSDVLAVRRARLCPSAVPEDRLVGWRVDGFWLVLGRVGMNLLAYREICPACGSSLIDAPIAAGVAICSICDHHYDLERGGRSLQADGLALQPAPVVREAIDLTA